MSGIVEIERSGKIEEATSGERERERERKENVSVGV